MSDEVVAGTGCLLFTALLLLLNHRLRICPRFIAHSVRLGSPPDGPSVDDNSEGLLLDLVVEVVVECD